jgi:hypothetical protein
VAAPQPPVAEVQGGFLAGAKVGGIVPFNGLSPHVTGTLELGYIFGWKNRSLGATLVIDYAAPGKDGRQIDGRVAAGGYDWQLRQQMLVFMPLLLYRFTWVSERFTPYVGAGPRLFLLKSTVRGMAGTSVISETQEQSTKLGVGLPLGIEIRLGPGALTVEILLQHADIEHTATGGARLGAGTLSVGYRWVM